MLINEFEVMNINEFDSLIKRPAVYLYHKPRFHEFGYYNF